MFDQTKYQHIWLKYSPAIRILLKKTDDTAQKLQLYKHEFESANKKDKLGYFFSFDLINGKVINITGGTTAARDLLLVIDNIPLVKNWLRDHRVRFSLKNNFELTMEKIEENQ
jgi:hypothetical protein